MKGERLFGQPRKHKGQESPIQNACWARIVPTDRRNQRTKIVDKSEVCILPASPSLTCTNVPAQLFLCMDRKADF